MTSSPAPPPPAAWLNAIDTWRTTLQAARLSPQTIALRTYHLRRLARAGVAHSPWDITTSDLLQWTGSHEWSRETARSVRSSLRRFWTWAVDSGRVTENVANALPAIPQATPDPRPAAPAAVVQAAGASDRRVRLMIRLANELGMRRGEVAQVHPRRDLVETAAGWSLVVHGKGSRRRVLPVAPGLAERLRDAPDGYLFPSPTGGHLTPHWVGTLVSRALADGTTMHQLRHLCATEIHEATRDIRLVQTILGHASVATTQRYVAVDDSRMRDAVFTRAGRWAHAA